uniref:Uncharacterized protein n=1 Tax=Triticum urartu TaxID=4572 RepID=A0A8R7UBT8_TRIUA
LIPEPCHPVEHPVDGDVEGVLDSLQLPPGIGVDHLRDEPHHLLPHPRHRRRRDRPEHGLDARRARPDAGLRDEHRVLGVVLGEVPPVL